MRLLAAPATGFIAGMLAGLLGIGGGLIIVPILHLWLGVPLKRSIGTSLAGVVAIAVIAVATEVVVAPDNLHLGPGFAMAVGASLGSAVGVRLVSALPTKILARIFAGLLLLTSARMSGLIPAILSSHWAVTISDLAMLVAHVAGGLMAGLVSALLGIGGGILAVPILATLHGDWPFHACRATSLLLIAPTSAIGAALHWRAGQLDRDLAVRLVPGAIVGSIAGVILANRSAERPLEIAFSILLVVAALRMLGRRTP